MELLTEIKDAEIIDDSAIKNRQASRAILFDENGLVPLLFVSKFNYHKLPGGGIDAGEDSLSALRRECMEEVGCAIEVTGEVGQISEYRSEFKLKRLSFCYLGNVISKGESQLMPDEIADGFKVVWMTLDEAIVQLEEDKPEEYAGFFIQKRDLAFLKKAKEVLSAKSK